MLAAPAPCEQSHGGAVQQNISNICGDGNSYNRTIQHGSRVGGYRAAGRWLVSLRIGSFNFSSFSSIEENKLSVYVKKFNKMSIKIYLESVYKTFIRQER